MRYLSSDKPICQTFAVPEQMFQMALLLVWDNNCAKRFKNTCMNVQFMPRHAQFMTILSFDLHV